MDLLNFVEFLIFESHELFDLHSFDANLRNELSEYAYSHVSVISLQMSRAVIEEY